MRFALFLFFILFSVSSHAYVQFIGHGYTSCLNCHFNPTGGGPLNDYGRVVSATLISSGALYPKTWKEEKVAYTSGFFFRKPKQEYIRTQFNYRGFQVVKDPGSTENEQKRWINMQADARLIIKSPTDKFVSVFNYGYSPLPEGFEGENKSEWRSREHYVGYRPNAKWGLYAGLMDKQFGLKIIEHIAFSRGAPLVSQNDQTHSVLGHYVGEKWEFFAQGIAGNLSQQADLRMKGGSFMAERTIFDIHRVGGAVLSQSNSYQSLLSYEGHVKLNLKDGSAVLGEIGQVKKTTENKSDDRTMTYGLLQTYLRPTRGLYFLTNIEYYKQTALEDDFTVRWGPGVQYFPVQRIELRFDIFDTRNFSSNASTKDSWMYLLQTHIWL